MRSAPEERGMTAIEVIVALAVFTVLLFILTSLQIQFLAFERDTDLELFDHPQKLAVLERVRRDVYDSLSYPALFQDWIQNPSTLILRGPGDETVVWVFDEHEAERVAWINEVPDSRWTAHGLPRFEVGAAEGAPGRVGVRLRAFDDEKRLIFDQVMFPRAR